MIDAADAEALRLLARRVRHLSISSRDPERFHMEKSEIEHDLRRLANRYGPAPKPVGQVTETTEIIAGRRVVIQRRRAAFSLGIG